MPDHQQAAVLALFEKIMGEDPTTPAPVRFALLSDEDKSVFREALAAAEPHLRNKWIENIKDKMPGLVDDTENDYARGVKAGIDYALFILEGATHD